TATDRGGGAAAAGPRRRGRRGRGTRLGPADGSRVPREGTGVARGNPVRIRDCPAAVSGNERRHHALGHAAWEATASRAPRERGSARESEDLPPPAHRPVRGGPRPRGKVGGTGAFAVCAFLPAGRPWHSEGSRHEDDRPGIPPHR